MAGTANAVPAVHCATAKFLAARLLARGQSHDAHTLDRVHFRKDDTFPPQAGGEGALWPAPVNPPEDGASLRIMPWRDRDIGAGKSTPSPSQRE